MSHQNPLIPASRLANLDRARRVTELLHVPTAACANAVVSAKRRRIRRRSPARDNRSACPNFSMISSMPETTCTLRPARDTGGPAPDPAADLRCARDRLWRSRSAVRNSSGASSRRAFACRKRRRERHSAEHVFCVFATDGCGRYHFRHSRHRLRRLSLLPIPKPSPKRDGHCQHRRHPPRGGQVSKWISTPPPGGSQTDRR